MFRLTNHEADVMVSQNVKKTKSNLGFFSLAFIEQVMTVLFNIFRSKKRRKTEKYNVLQSYKKYECIKQTGNSLRQISMRETKKRFRNSSEALFCGEGEIRTPGTAYRRTAV